MYAVLAIVCVCDVVILVLFESVPGDGCVNTSIYKSIYCNFNRLISPPPRDIQTFMHNEI